MNTELPATNGCDGRRSTDGRDVFEETHYLPLSRIRLSSTYRGADKSLARPGRKQAKATEDFEFHISYL